MAGRGAWFRSCLGILSVTPVCRAGNQGFSLGTLAFYFYLIVLLPKQAKLLSVHTHAHSKQTHDASTVQTWVKSLILKKGLKLGLK